MPWNAPRILESQPAPMTNEQIPSEVAMNEITGLPFALADADGEGLGSVFSAGMPQILPGLDGLVLTAVA